MNLDIEAGGKTHRVVVERAGARYRVDIDGRAYSVDLARVDAATLSLIVDGDEAARSYEVGFAERVTPDEWEVYLRAGVVYTRLDGRGGRRVRRSLGADPFAPADGVHEVLAPMPGRIVKVLVAPGDEVAARQGLVVVEAMKMETELRAPRAARVKDVTASEGMSVEAGRVLVVLE